MALQTSGAISINDIHVEAGGSSGSSVTINDTDVRALISKASGAASNFGEWYGASAGFVFTISSNVANANLRTLAVAAGWNQSSHVKAIVANGVYLYSTSTSNYGLTINGSWPSGVWLENDGFIAGKGGNGGQGCGLAFPSSQGNLGGSAGTAGGPALYVNTAVTIDNKRIVGGGGGGGGGGGSLVSGAVSPNAFICGGGGGGGRSNGSSGSGGTSGGWGTPGGSQGSNGSLSAAGSGGASGGQNPGYASRPGGAGGNYGYAGAAGPNGGKNGGGAGACTSGNSYITWWSTGTRNGTLG